MSNFYTLLTRVGAALHANAQVNQTTVPWTHMRLGDGNGAAVVPTENQAGLVRQVHTLQITDISVHPDNPNWVIAEAVVPSDVGGWTVREAAIYGGAGGNTCIAVGNYPETYKPVLAEGAGREMVMRMVVEISSVATVKLQIDPAVAIASRAWVESLVATPAKAGLVKFANLQEHLDGETSSKAATPAGVHAVVGIAAEQLMGDVLAVEARVSILEAIPKPIGHQQVLKDVLASRALGVNYLNDTGRTITASVSVQSTGNGAALSYYIDNEEINRGTYCYNGNAPTSVNFTVGPGKQYRVSIYAGTGALAIWKEER